MNSTKGNGISFINRQFKLDDKGCRGCGGDRNERPMDYLCRPRGDNWTCTACSCTSLPNCKHMWWFDVRLWDLIDPRSLLFVIVVTSVDDSWQTRTKGARVSRDIDGIHSNQKHQKTWVHQSQESTGVILTHTTTMTHVHTHTDTHEHTPSLSHKPHPHTFVGQFPKSVALRGVNRASKHHLQRGETKKWSPS